MIALETLGYMFAGKQQDDNQPLLWGYSFSHTSRHKLDEASRHLSSHGYQLVGIDQASETDQNVLHMERFERHSLHSLLSRQQELQWLAEHFGLEPEVGFALNAPPSPQL